LNPSLLPLLIAMAGRAAQRGTLIEIVETFAKLVRLVEPLISTQPDAAPDH
jgi:hypothetical protein